MFPAAGELDSVHGYNNSFPPSTFPYSPLPLSFFSLCSFFAHTAHQMLIWRQIVAGVNYAIEVKHAAGSSVVKVFKPLPHTGAAPEVTDVSIAP